MAKSGKKQIQSYVASIMASQVDYLETQINGVISKNDIDYVHHTRTISRRLRSTITVFTLFLGKKQSKNWFTNVRELTKSLTKARDLDIQIDFLSNRILTTNQTEMQGINRLLLRKKQQREKLQPEVEVSIQEFLQSNALNEMKEFVSIHQVNAENLIFSNELYELAQNSIDERIKYCFSFVPFITNPDNVEDLHNLRIAIKNLRYSTELFQKIYPDLPEYIKTLKSFQDMLGEIHDADVWLIDLTKFESREQARIIKFYGQAGAYNFLRPGIEAFRQETVQRRDDLYNKLLEEWNKVFQALFWSYFRETIHQTPLLTSPEDSEVESFPEISSTIETQETNQIEPISEEK